jgi:hypothetical protein
MLLLKSSASERSVDSASHPRARFLPQAFSALYFHYASGFVTQILAYMLDSLVRVSRRVEENHFVNNANPPSGTPNAVFTFRTDRTLFSHALGQTNIKVPTPESGGLSLLTQKQCRPHRLNESEETHQPTWLLQSH